MKFFLETATGELVQIFSDGAAAWHTYLELGERTNRIRVEIA